MFISCEELPKLVTSLRVSACLWTCSSHQKILNCWSEKIQKDPAWKREPFVNPSPLCILQKWDLSSRFLSLQPVLVPLGLDQIYHLRERCVIDCCSLCGCSQLCPQLCPQLYLSPSLALATYYTRSFPCPSTYCCSPREAGFLPLTKVGHTAFLSPSSHILLSAENLQCLVWCWQTSSEVMMATQGCWDGRCYEGLAFLLSWWQWLCFSLFSVINT